MSGRRSRPVPPSQVAWTPWRFRLVAYGVPVLAALIATATWTKPGTFFASGDVPPFEWRNSAAELTALWNHQTVGTGSASYQIVRLPQVALVFAAGRLGLSPVVAQYAFFAAVWSLAAFGGAYLAAVWARRPAAAATAGLAAAFNAYLLVNHPNPLPALAIGLTGVLVGMTLRAGAVVVGGWSAQPLPGSACAPPRARIRPVYFALATLPACYLAQNPPLLLVAAVAVAVSALAARPLIGRGATGRALRLLLPAAPIAVLLNLWWLVPYAMTLAGMPGLVLGASTDVAAWGWTHARATLANVATLNAHWGWQNLTYFPYRPAMEAWGWTVLRWALPALAVAGVLLADRARRRMALSLGAVCLPMIALGTGLHPPLGRVNQWLFENVPGLWLLRDPSMKVAVVQVLCYAVLGAVAVDRLLSLDLRRAARRAVRGATAAAVLAVLACPWPLWTGAVVPEYRPGLTGSHVRIPSDWYAAAAAVNASPAQGKVLILPLDTYYQVTTTWGYHGVDTIPAQLIDRPVLNLLPGGYFRAAGSADALVTGVQEALLSGDGQAALAGLRALGVGQVVVRHDLVTSVQEPQYANADALRRAADSALWPAGRYPLAEVYQVPGATGEVLAYRTVTSVVDDGNDTDVLSALGPDGGTVAATDAGVAADQVLWQPGGSDSFALASAGWYTVDLRSRSPVLRAEVVRDGIDMALRLTDTVRVAVDGAEVPPRPARPVLLDPRTVAIASGGRLQPVSGAGTLLQWSSGALRLTPYVPAPDGGLQAFGPGGDCNRADTANPDLTVTSPASGTLRLGASTHVACISAAVRAGAADAVLVGFEYRRLSGAPARACLWEAGARACAAMPDPPAGNGWQAYRAAVAVPAGAGPLSLYLYADGGAPQRTVVEYRSVRVDPLLALPALELPSFDPPVVRRYLSAGRHTVSVRQQFPATVLDPPGPLGDCNNATGAPPAQRGLGLERDGDVVRLTAATDIACVQLAAGGPVAERYRLELEYRTVAGRPARICLWQVGPDRCAPLPQLANSTSWTRLSTVVQPEAGTRQLLLYLYADGQARSLTRVEFRSPTLTVSSGLSVRVGRDSPAPAQPALAVTASGTADFRVRASGVGGRFALVLTEARAPGWRLSGLPAGWSATVFTAQGYGNGWIVTGHGDAQLRITYAPSRYTGLAGRVSLVTAVLATLLAVFRPRRRLRLAGPVRHQQRGAGTARGRTAEGRVPAAAPVRGGGRHRA